MQRVGGLTGLIVGLVFGVVWVRDSFADAVLVVVVGIVGYYVGSFLSGEIDLGEILARRNR